MSRGTLTIEVGLTCNNQCRICPQAVLRCVAPVAEGLATDEIKRRIASGAAACDELALTGGEPTLRPDLCELIAFGRNLGFCRVSISTNGRRFAYREYARRLLEAGLGRASISLHGPDATVHDGLTGVAGSFAQTIAGIENLRREATRLGVSFEMNSVTVLVPDTVGRLRETLSLAGRLGIRLHIVQPFILSREDLHRRARYLLPLREIVSGIERALQDGLPHGGRIKPYNIPRCRLGHLAQFLDDHAYPVMTRREFQETAGLPSGRVPACQTFRIAACATCDEACPGIRMEHLPEEALIREIAAATRSRLVLDPGTPVLLTGLDLLSEAGLAALLERVRVQGPSAIRVVWGGNARVSGEAFEAICRDAGVTEICAIVWPESSRLPDRRVRLPGNLSEIRAYLEHRAPGSPEPSLLVVLNTLFLDDFGLDRAGLLRLGATLRKSGGTVLYFVAPEVLPDHFVLPSNAFRERVRTELPALVSDLRALGLSPRLVRVPEPPLALDGERIQAIAARLLPTEDWSAGLVRHPFTGPGAAWVMWSDPVWIFPVDSSERTPVLDPMWDDV